MRYQAVFQRYELKFMLSVEQKKKIIEEISPYMKLDKYGRTTIRNIYFDTEDYRLIRKSIERPVYKEKLRLRSYNQANDQSPVFVELKKKYNSVVYKRRVLLLEKEAVEWVCNGNYRPQETQITREIDYFLEFYKALRPRVFLSYEREAYHGIDDRDFRITFDEHILYRQNQLTLESEVYGKPLIEEGKVLMEIKCMGAIPLWLVAVLSSQHIYKTSFSKYGTVYEKIIFPEFYKKENVIYV